MLFFETGLGAGGDELRCAIGKPEQPEAAVVNESKLYGCVFFILPASGRNKVQRERGGRRQE